MPTRRFILILLTITFSGPVAAQADPPDLHPLVEALRQKGCATDPRYHAIADVLCPATQASPPTEPVATAVEPDDVLMTIGTSTKQQIAALSLQARKEDTACAQGAANAIAAGTSVGPTNTDQLVSGLVKGAVESAVTINPAALIVSIPGLTQVQYEYKGLADGPELRRFKITGHVDGDVFHATLHLQMEGDVEGNKNLYVQYTVNYRTTKSPFPAWSPFLESPGDIQLATVRQGLDTLSPTAIFEEQGEHRNGVQAWHGYDYVWHAEKIGALPTDIVKPGTGPITAVAKYPYGGDWVGSGWGAETRFVQNRQQFVSQFSRAAASTMTPEEGSQGVIMSLNVKHQTVFYFHIDFDGNVTGRGVIVYTLDPNLCGVATLTRQVNEAVNLLKYLPVIYAVGQQLADYAVSRFNAAWTTEPTTITQSVDEFIKTLPPKIEPSQGAADIEEFLAANSNLKVKSGQNVAFADVNVDGYPSGRLWRPSGDRVYPDNTGVVPLGSEEEWEFKTAEWAKKYVDESGWNEILKGKKPYDRPFDSERIIMEYLGKTLPEDASGTIRIYSKFPVCPSCTGVIEQFYCRFPKIILLVTSGG